MVLLLQLGMEKAATSQSPMWRWSSQPPSIRCSPRTCGGSLGCALHALLIGTDDWSGHQPHSTCRQAASGKGGQAGRCGGSRVAAAAPAAAAPTCQHALGHGLGAAREARSNVLGPPRGEQRRGELLRLPLGVYVALHCFQTSVRMSRELSKQTEAGRRNSGVRTAGWRLVHALASAKTVPEQN